MMFPTIYIRKTEETLLNINIVPCTFENMYLGSFSKCRVCRKFEHPTRKRKLTQVIEYCNRHQNGNHSTSDRA